MLSPTPWVDRGCEDETTDTRMKTTDRAPFRFCRGLYGPIGVFRVGEDCSEVVRAIRRQIFMIFRNDQCGAWVYGRKTGEGAMELFVVSDMRTVACDVAMRVGYYAITSKDRAKGWQDRVLPTMGDLMLDLTQHAIDIQVVTPADIYDVVRYGDDHG